MAFELLEVKNEEKNVIFNLMQLYTYELSFLKMKLLILHFWIQDCML